MIKISLLMLKTTLSFFFFFLMAFQASAQNDSVSYANKKFVELGIDLLWLIDKETYPGYTLFGRYHVRQTPLRGQALRLRMGGRFLYPEYENGWIHYSIEKNHDYAWLIRPGWEWQRKKGRAIWSLGIDLPVSYSSLLDQHQETETVDSINGIYVLVTDESVFTAGLGGILGVRYRLSPRISMYWEAGVDAMYIRERSRYLAVLATEFPSPDEAYNTTEGDRFDARFNFMTTLSLTYTLVKKPDTLPKWKG